MGNTHEHGAVPAVDLAVSEIFGPTFQGEGASLGTRAGFVRLARCNLSCGGPGPASWACDTPYTWDWEGQNGTRYEPSAEVTKMSVAEVADRVRAMKTGLVVVTGGEPLLQARAVAELASSLAGGGVEVEIETNGTLAPAPELVEAVTRFNVSPKLASSGVPLAQRRKPAAIAALAATGKAVWKFVCAGEADLDEVARDFGDLSPVFVMPAGTTASDVIEVSRRLAGPVLERGWSMTTRLHVLLWGDERGR